MWSPHQPCPRKRGSFGVQILTWSPHQPCPRKRGSFGDTQPGAGSHLAPCRPDPLLSRCAANQPGFVAMVKALTRLVFPLISCCTKATAALHLSAMAQQQGTPTPQKQGTDPAMCWSLPKTLLQATSATPPKYPKPICLKPHKSSRDFTITQKGAGQFSDLIIRGCISPYLKRRWCISNPRLQSPNHHIFLWVHMKGLSSFPTVSMVSENKDPVVSVEPNWDQQHTRKSRD